MKITEAIAHLREAERAATPAPWGWESHGEKCNCAVLGTFYNLTGELMPGRVHSEEYDEAAGDYRRVADCDEVIAGKDDNANYSDFNLIALLRNVAPQALALIESQAAENKYFRSHFGRLLELSDKTDAVEAAFAEVVAAAGGGR